ncbi:pogo transposable element derived with ZNF domain b isoform X2 [Kryptolebias marmoratus]|uniref:pogo transposable element derived with ZNF domain b isoform X2 n=1 Tax=Kryptolebias marmoratus TaxID=37003 RepID=UPI0018AC9478|nr:pogo transposable element derived with ZNF domain b isoform X2 [Kryptolebias marmoratus]
MDTQLFMECEEEELEPWQQVNDSVEEDDMDFMDNYCEPVEDSLSPLPASETPPPRTPPPITPAPTVSSPLRIVSSSVMSLPPSSITATCSTLSLPTSSKPIAPPLIAQAPPLILTQTAGGTFLLPAASRTGSGQPILLTAQGFQVPTMVSPGTPLVLNLQSGQTVQPLTLIQSPSLGQLVRPGVAMSPLLSQGQTGKVSAPSGGFTTVQLPTTLTIRTSTPGPVNLQVTKVRSTNSLNLAACPAPLSAPANGVTKATPLSSGISHAPSVGTTAPASSPTQVVMSVDDFYYGRFSGDVSLRGPQMGIKTLSFTCTICSSQAENNLRLMEHMLQHSDLIAEGGNSLCCRFCYRQFSSSSHLKTHQEQVHGSALSSCLCRICEWAFEDEPVFLNHMKSNHKPGEMPYVCQVCSYRSSFYSDVLKHFASFHRDSLFLLCIYCLKVTRNPVGYQQHLLRHKVNQGFHCNRCRLQFVFLKDKMQHKLENHRSFRRPPQLEGLPPGSKVAIRTYGKLKPPSVSASMVQPNRIRTEPQNSLVQKNSPLHKSPKSPNKRSVSRRDLVSRSVPGEGGRLVCLECGTDASDLSAHYPTYVHCLLCPYSSCCSRAYAAHMIHHHVPSSRDQVLPLQRLPPPSAFLLRCSDCDFQPPSADPMADHLLEKPEHDSAICRQRYYTESDIQFFPTEEPQSLEEPVQNQDLLEPSWMSADNWKDPSESTKTSILDFTHPCGPYHIPSRNCDAIDFFSLIFPSALIELIARETNTNVKACHILGSGPVDWVPVTTHEIKGFIGLVILMGIHNLPDLLHYWSWKHYDNSYTFYRAMSFKRFQQIAANICMGSFITNELGGSGTPNDPLHVFRPMLNILGGAMWSAYEPNCCLTVDRTLLPSLDEDSSSTKGNPKTQPQVWLLCDSKSGYCHRFFIQVGQKTGQDLGFTVVPELMKDLNNKNHQLFLASSLTSIPLMQKLLDQGIYASSSFPPPNPILPQELWDRGQLEKPGDFLQRQFGPLLATRWKDTKEMGCLSTNAAPGEPDTVWRRSPTTSGELVPISRPMAFRLLQENMRGVDICKQLQACNPLGGIPQDRHWRNLFWFLINLSVVNAFIVLRESRKEHPPAWVQDGLFTQVNFRKRLGNQLAKCAQKYLETLELAISHKSRTETTEEAVKQRHRMAKISSISKRCKNCNLKNLRHESVYGCTICKANLCKQPSCFWEYHGLSPVNKGSTKVGFFRNRISGAVDVEEVVDNLDEAMAPVEDLDFSDDDTLDDLEDVEENETVKEEDLCNLDSVSQLLSETTAPVQTAAQSPASKEDFLSARQLRIILFALCEGLQQASRVFSTKTPLIRSWLKEAKRRLKRTEQEQRIYAGGSDQMLAWVLFMREQQLPITESNLFNKASMLKKKGAFGESFRISYDWAVSFLLQHQLGVRSAGRVPSLTRLLPSSLETKVRSFRDFTQKVFHVHQLTESSVAAMDELCLFVDLRLAQDKSCCSEALELIGSSPLITVYLTVLADGTMLPSLALTTRQLPEKVLPESVLLEVSPESLSIEDILDLWTSKVWLKHLSTSAQPSKSMLVLDRHREHLGDPFLSSLSGSCSLPAVIPGGCSFCLQPLEICLKPVLQRFLLSRWSEFTARNPPELEETEPARLQINVTQQLIDWVVEALTHLNKLPQVWKQSFHLTGLLPAPRGLSEETEDKTSQKPEDIQADLLKTLTQMLLGPETTETCSPELQELEDEEGDEQETSEDQQDTKVERMEVEETERKTEDRKEVEGQEVMETEDKDREEKDLDDHEKETKEEGLKYKEKEGEMMVKDSEDRMKEDRKEKTETREEDSEEEGKETEEDRKDVSKERRETRIVIGKEVGDEWKILVKTRTEGAATDGDEEDRMDIEDE